MELTRASIHRLLESFDWISGVTHTRDFNALLHSNDPPTSLQSVDLKHSIENMDFVSQQIQAALDLLGNAVMSLEAHMSRIQSLQRDYDVVLSPIRRVPMDIIMEILYWTQTPADDSEEATFGGYNVFTCAEGPRLLGQVCSSWRDIVNGFPRLWATMTISIPNPWIRSWAGGYFMEMLEYALERTRGHPLEFLFEHHEEGSTEGYEIMNSCFDLMMGHSVRWRRAGFIVLPFFLPCLSHFRGKIDWLEDVHVHCHADMPGRQPSSVTGFEIAPRLKSLHLTGIDDRVRFPFPTANLISFYDQRAFGRADRYAEYIRIVRSSPNLISLWVHDHALPQAVTPRPSDPRITSESIQALSVSSATFMDMLDVPSLREVVLKPTYNLPSLQRVSIKPLSQLIQRSHCSLTRLSVINVVIVADDLVNVLQLTPCLRELSVRFDTWSLTTEPCMQPLVDSLSETVLRDGQVQHSLVPSLTSLGIVLSGVGTHQHISFVNPSFVAMITSRHETGVLMKLVLHIEGRRWTFGLSSADETELMLLQLSGLALDYVAKDH